MDSLGEALPREIARVRDELLPVYMGLPNGVGTFASSMMRADLDRASKAMIAGDLPEMIRVYESLKGYTL